MNKIRVAVDATPLLLRSAGVKNYTYYWVRSLIEGAGGHAVSLFPYLDGLGTFAHETSVLGPAATVSRLALLHAANVVPLPLLNWFTPKADVFHASHQLHRPPRRARLTATIYDMTCWLMPEMHTAANVKASKRIAERVFRVAEGLIAISESARADAVRVLGLEPEKIAVIYPGIAPAFFVADSNSGREVARRYGLAKPYVLYVGTVEPRKNLPALVDAWEQLPAGVHEAFELAIVGSWGWGDRSTQQRLQSGVPGVRHVGYVPEQDLPALTAAATAVAFVSLYEGFGLPLAQAMAAGVPVITSNVSALPEVAGDAALLVDPRSREEIRAALERLLGAPSLRSELAARGRQRAQKFTWEAAAKQSWAFFERMCG
jgi:glycosyltransferase involved in cell wall biosynthesis